MLFFRATQENTKQHKRESSVPFPDPLPLPCKPPKHTCRHTHSLTHIQKRSFLSYDFSNPCHKGPLLLALCLRNHKVHTLCVCAYVREGEKKNAPYKLVHIERDEDG